MFAPKYYFCSASSGFAALTLVMIVNEVTLINVVNRNQRTMTKWSFWNMEWCFPMSIIGLLIICPLHGVTILKKMVIQIQMIPTANFANLVSQWDAMFRRMENKKMHVLWVHTIRMQIHSISLIIWISPFIIMKVVKTMLEIDLYKHELYQDRKFIKSTFGLVHGWAFRCLKKHLKIFLMWSIFFKCLLSYLKHWDQITRLKSIFRHDWSKGDECKESKNPMAIPAKLKDPLEVTYSYSVTFLKNNNVKWASRWDYILDSMPHTDIQVDLLSTSGNFKIYISKVVRYHEFLGYRSFPFWYGCNDYDSISP